MTTDAERCARPGHPAECEIDRLQQNNAALRERLAEATGIEGENYSDLLAAAERDLAEMTEQRNGLERQSYNNAKIATDAQLLQYAAERDRDALRERLAEAERKTEDQRATLSKLELKFLTVKGDLAKRISDNTALSERAGDVANRATLWIRGDGSITGPAREPADTLYYAILGDLLRDLEELAALRKP